MKRWACNILVIMCLLPLVQLATAQDSAKGKRGFSSVNKAAGSLRKSLSANDEIQTARQYEVLAKELTAKEEYSKAEDYMKKARDIYARLNRNEEAAAASRELAKVQELQNKIVPAIKNYQSAAEIAGDKNLEQVNVNDANRLRNNNNPALQMDYARSNISIFEKEGKKEEAVNAYQQLAKSQLQQNRTKDAVASYNKAIEKSDNSRDIAGISKKIADVFVEDNEVDKAIHISEGILGKARIEHDSELQIEQSIALAQLYAQNNQLAKAITVLEEAYALAFKTRNTLKAKACLLSLAGYYKAQNNLPVALARYEAFLGGLDSLIRTDSSLVDASLFEETEGRIKDLEREKLLQGQLISEKNTLNYILIASVIAMLLLLAFIIRSLRDIRIKNKRIALQSLRREMNPHFIFNSLNSVNQYIAENNEVEANHYLTAYSGMMRNVMEHSNKDFVTLSAEAEQLEKYLGLEHLRFSDKFDYEVQMDDALDADVVMIPNMLIQPHLENAIWHGLRYKAAKGLLRLHFNKMEKEIRVIIEDDGIGLTESAKLKTVNQKAHQSRGIVNTMERISLLNDLYRIHIRITIEEISGNGATGTRVIIQLPLSVKQ